MAHDPLRLRLGDAAAADRLDGGWWPHSRDLAVELAHLVDEFPAEHGRITRAVFSPPDWDGPCPRRVRVARGQIRVGSFPRDDSHTVRLRTSDGRVLHLLVVPPHFTGAQGTEALLAAATPRNTHSAGELLDTVTAELAVDPGREWNDYGVSCFDPAPLDSAPGDRDHRDDKHEGPHDQSSEPQHTPMTH